MLFLFFILVISLGYKGLHLIDYINLNLYLNNSSRSDPFTNLSLQNLLFSSSINPDENNSNRNDKGKARKIDSNSSSESSSESSSDSEDESQIQKAIRLSRQAADIEPLNRIASQQGAGSSSTKSKEETTKLNEETTELDKNTTKSDKDTSKPDKDISKPDKNYHPAPDSGEPQDLSKYDKIVDSCSKALEKGNLADTIEEGKPLTSQNKEDLKQLEYNLTNRWYSVKKENLEDLYNPYTIRDFLGDERDRAKFFIEDYYRHIRENPSPESSRGESTETRNRASDTSEDKNNSSDSEKNNPSESEDKNNSSDSENSSNSDNNSSSDSENSSNSDNNSSSEGGGKSSGSSPSTGAPSGGESSQGGASGASSLRTSLLVEEPTKGEPSEGNFSIIIIELLLFILNLIIAFLTAYYFNINIPIEDIISNFNNFS